MLTLSDIERIENWTKGVMHIPIHIGANLQETIDLCADWRELKEQLDAARRDEADTETFFIVELEGTAFPDTWYPIMGGQDAAKYALPAAELEARTATAQTGRQARIVRIVARREVLP
jgi:hypothetical protein